MDGVRKQQRSQTYIHGIVFQFKFATVCLGPDEKIWIDLQFLNKTLATLLSQDLCVCLKHFFVVSYSPVAASLIPEQCWAQYYRIAYCQYFKFVIIIQCEMADTISYVENGSNII